MDATSVIQGALKQGHDMAEQAVANLTPEQLHQRGDNSTIESIAVIYAHAVMSEDGLVNGMLRHQAPLFERADWGAKVGIKMPESGGGEVWAASVPNADFGALRQYAEQVYAETDDYLGSLTPADLDTVVDTGFMGEMSTGTILGNIIVWHALHHSGEICALKGVLGEKGLPF